MPEVSSLYFIYILFISSLDGTISVIVLAKVDNAFGLMSMKSKTSLIFKTKGEVPADRILLGWYFKLQSHFGNLEIEFHHMSRIIMYHSQVLLDVYFYVYLCSNGKEMAKVLVQICRFRMLGRDLRHIIYRHYKSPGMPLLNFHQPSLVPHC